MKNFKYIIHTLGCKVNQYDSFVLEIKLGLIGFEKDINSPDLLIINTCAVTKISLRKAQKIINKLRKENKNAKFLVFGCGVKIYPEKFIKQNFDLIHQVGDLDEIIQKVKKLFNLNNSKIKNKNIQPKEKFKSRYTIKIQDGCEQFCSYCIIPYARGKLKSRKLNEILDEVKKSVEHNYQEIVFCGIHLGLYGVDLEDDLNLVELLKKVLKIKGLGRIRLSSIEINDVSDDLIKLMAKNKKICPHLHISLQSGDDKILKLMNRPYDTSYFAKRVLKIKKNIPKIAITTDVIVGFPQETEENFQNTCDFVNKIKFSKVHVFPFSGHEKTPAFNMLGQIELDEIKKRANILRKISQKLKIDYEKFFAGEKLNVLIEKKEQDYYIGKSEYYFECRFKNKKNLKIGSIIKCFKIYDK